MSELVIVGSRLSPFVEKVCSAIEYKRINYTLNESVGFSELPKLNPVTRKIPVAIFDGETVYDSTFILRKLDAIHPDPPLLDEDAEIAAAQRQLEDWADESLYWYLMALRWCDENQARTVAELSEFLPGGDLRQPAWSRELMSRYWLHESGATDRPD